VPRSYRLLLVGLLAWSVLAFGGVYPWAYWPVIVISAGLGAWAIPITAAWRDARVRTLGLALCAVAAAIAVQLVPLPPDMVLALSPDTARWLREARFGLTADGGWRPLSLAPRDTAIVLTEFVAFALLLIGLVRAIRHVGIPWLLTQLAGLGMGLAVLGVVQRLLTDADQPLVYGFWRPVQGGNPFGPFVNRNHFAGWMVMALPLLVAFSMGLALDRDGSRRDGWANWLRWSSTVEAHRVLVVVASALGMGLALVVTGSRSGLASLAVGLTAVAALMWRRLPTRGARLAAVTYVVLVMLGAVGWAGVDRTLDRFGPASRDFTSRMAAWRDTLRMVEGFPWAGVGLGAYGEAMLVYQSGPREVQYVQAHNDYLQLAAEGGLLVGLPALGLALVVIRHVRRRCRSGEDAPLTQWIRAGAVGGLVGIAAQSLVEFSLHLPGNGVLFVLLMALALHRPSRPPAHAHRV
jgi:O-antigen ligase